MLTVTREVYYCEFCKRHRLTKQAIETHEPKCIYNPNRSACGWHDDRKPVGPRRLAAGLRDNLDVQWLRIGADGCPACMLAVVVQANLNISEREDLDFDYQDEVARFRADERLRADLADCF